MNEKYEMAESIVKNIKKNDILSWKEIVDIYLQYSKIELIIDLIPILGNGSENKAYHIFYERILASLLKNKSDLFCACITKWPKSCYSSCEIIKLINSSNIDCSNKEILSAKAFLTKYSSHSQNKDYVEALNIFISLKEPKALELIVQHKLFSRFKLYLIDLIEINALLELCIKYTPEKAFPIIRNSSDYNVPKALQICKKSNLFNEYAFLCGKCAVIVTQLERSGDLQTALETYLFKLNDIQKAVELCNRIQDQNFWDLLISFCVVDPKNICVLLTNTSHQLDLCKLIQKIPNGVCLDKLRETITKIFYDVHTRVHLELIKCLNVVPASVVCYFFIKTAAKKCSVCHETIIVEQSFYVQDVVIFLCDHAYHSDCLSKKIGRDDVCIYCNSDHFIKPEKLYKIRLS
ncbi:hypothetical protein MXB_5160 [Myxobolus squamalis]|nr:hypothetical protein MXB_5160 [Myxobolus squamalis]